MPGVARRDKPLKATGLFSDLDGVTLSSVSAYDLLSFIGGEWVNTKSLTGDYEITGSLTVNDIILSAELSVGTDLNVTGDVGATNAAFSGTLDVDGASTLQAITVAGAAILQDSLTVAGTLSGVGFSFSGDATIGGDLAVTGETTLSAVLTGTTAMFSGAIAAAGLVSTGPSIFDDDLTVNANISAGAIGGTSLSTGGDISLSGSLNGATWSILNSSGDITLELTRDDGTLTLLGKSNPGSGQEDRTLAVFDPDGPSELYHAGALQLATDSFGIAIYDVSGDEPVISLYQDDLTTRNAFIQAHASTGLIIRNLVHGLPVFIQSEDAGGTARHLILADPDTTTSIYGAGTKNIEVGASTLGFLGTTGISKPTVSGSRGGNAALASLLTALASYGLITDSSS